MARTWVICRKSYCFHRFDVGTGKMKKKIRIHSTLSIAGTMQGVCVCAKRLPKFIHSTLSAQFYSLIMLEICKLKWKTNLYGLYLSSLVIRLCTMQFLSFTHIHTYGHNTTNRIIIIIFTFYVIQLKENSMFLMKLICIFKCTVRQKHTYIVEHT